MATLSLRDVRKSFGKTEAVRGVDVEIADGEFVVIVGPSGCGKSTLLRMVAGLETVTSGDILIDGERANDREPMDRDIAMVFQNYALYPHMSVRKNMGYGLKIAGVPKPEIERKVREAAELLQIGELLDRKPRELSGGQRQRVAMGRAIVRQPSVFLFDEPLSNLDAKLRVQMRLEIRALQAKLGVTSLYVTHDQVEAMTMADRMIVMQDGVAEHVGTPLEVYESPRTLFAAQFVGSPAMNVMEARLEGGAALVGGVRACAAPEGAGDGASALAGIRPEHAVPDPEGSFSFRVSAAEPLGASTILHGRLAQGDVPFTLSVPGVHRVAGGNETMSLSFPETRIRLFDPASGHALSSSNPATEAAT